MNLSDNQINALENLSKNNLHFNRISDDTWIVYTSGYKTGDCYKIESYLMKSGFMCLSMTFDNHCGKTMSKYIALKNN